MGGCSSPKFVQAVQADRPGARLRGGFPAPLARSQPRVFCENTLILLVVAKYMTKSWMIHGRDTNSFTEARSVDGKTLLGDVIAMWARDRDLTDWDGREKMASVAFYFTDLTETEIRGIFGTDGRGEFPGEPPWAFPHPDGSDDEIYIEENVEDPDNVSRPETK